MKKVLLLLTLILGITFSFGQNDCSQDDGTFKYQAKLYIENVSNDFDKDDFINHIIGLDNISNEDLATLNEHLTLVYKTFPSQNPHRMVTIVATIEIYSILADLNNSIELHYCVVTDCTQNDGTFSYYALLTSNNIPIDFDKDDFINYILGLDNISNEDLATLNTHIISVNRAFPTAQSEFLQRVVVIDATIEIYSILADLINSIEHHSCIDDEIILGVNDIKKNKHSIVFPNPITKNSVIKLNMDFTDIKIEILNSLGQIIYHNRYSGNDTIELKNISIDNGIYFIKIYDLTSGTNETLKIVKEK
jgi:hypothetical protein